MPKISQFPAGGVAQNTDLIPIVRNGGDYTVTGYNLASLAAYGQAYVGTFTATAGQTVFTLPASPGSLANLFIAVDGAVMVPGSDYTWTTPTTLTFLVGLKVSQTVLYNYTTSVPIGTSLAGGVSGQVQYNNSGVLNGTTIGGDATLVATTGVMKVNSVQASAIVDASLSASSNIGLTNTALVTIAATFNDGTNTISGGYRVYAGNNAASTDDSAYLVGRGLSGSYASGAHAFRDESTYTSPSGTGLFGYASFDAIPKVGGSVHWNHVRGFQSRPEFTGSNTNDEAAMFHGQLTHSGAGTITNAYSFKAMNALGGGPISNQYAFFVDPSFAGGTANYALYSGSATVQSYHAGLFQFGSFPKIAGLTTYGALFSHDATGNFLDNPNLTIVNGVLTMAYSTAKVLASATNLVLDSTSGTVNLGGTAARVIALAPVIFKNYTVATLPAAANNTYGKAFVTDANATMTAGIGAIVAAGGANIVPVYSDGTNWRIG